MSEQNVQKKQESGYPSFHCGLIMPVRVLESERVGQGGRGVVRLHEHVKMMAAFCETPENVACRLSHK